MYGIEETHPRQACVCVCVGREAPSYLGSAFAELAAEAPNPPRTNLRSLTCEMPSIIAAAYIREYMYIGKPDPRRVQKHGDWPKASSEQ